MNREAGATTTLLVGALLVRLGVTGLHRRYVRPSMGPWLIVAGLLLAIFGAVALAAALRRTPNAARAGERPDRHRHPGHGVERVGWVLLGPVVAVLLVAPPALGSYGVDRAARVEVRAGEAVFTPLSPSEGPRAMTLLEFWQRTVDHNGASFNGVPVVLTGFVVRTDGSDTGDEFRIARYQIACCAADAAASVVRVVGTVGPPPAADRWVTVTGTFGGAGDQPELLATSVVEIPTPGEPYE